MSGLMDLERSRLKRKAFFFILHMFHVPIDIIYMNIFLFSIFPDVSENITTNFLCEYCFPVFSGPDRMYPNFHLSHKVHKYLG